MKLPETKEGEIYIGAFINADGTGHHTILLPDDYEPDTWQNQMAKAALTGADPPNRAELVTMCEKFPALFKKAWYWSNTTHQDTTERAWCQYFGNGGHDDFSKSFEFGVRFVRRIPME